MFQRSRVLAVLVLVGSLAGAAADPPKGRDRKPALVELKHGTRVTALGFAPDGRTLASGSDEWSDRAMKVWDVPTGRELGGFKGAKPPFAFCPDGKTLATGSADPEVVLWDVPTGERRAALRGEASALVFSPDGESLAAARWFTAVSLWDLAARKKVAVFPGGPAVAFSPDGQTLAVRDWDRAPRSSRSVIKLWDLQTGKERATLDHSLPVWSVAFSPDGTTLASSGFELEGATPRAEIKVWEVATGKEQGRPLRIVAPHFRGSPDGKGLAVVARPEVGKPDVPAYAVVDAATGTDPVILERARPGRDPRDLERFEYTPDGSAVAIRDRGVRLLDARTGVLRASFEREKVERVAFSPDGKTVAVGDANGTVALWELPPGR